VSWRRIVVDNTSWRYHVGHAHVLARAKDRRLVAPLHIVVGITQDAFEISRRKGSPTYGAVKPGDVARWIRAVSVPLDSA